LSRSFIYRHGTQTRFIPDGFDRLYFDYAHFQHHMYGSESGRAKHVGLHMLLNYCINGTGHMNELVLLGIFSSFDNRSDAIQVIRYFRQEDAPSRLTRQGFDSPRSEVILRLLETSFWIDDVSNMQRLHIGDLFITPRLRGWQLTYNPVDLNRWNAELTNATLPLAGSRPLRVALTGFLY
jgi:hypothetical protein